MSNVKFLSSHLGSRCEELLFGVSQKLKSKTLLIEDIGDYMPGSIMVQDLSIMTNVYMNNYGCEVLRHSSEELTSLGSAYFDRFFPADEIPVLMKNISGFIAQNDPEKSISFFQRVRASEDEDYKWYFTTSRLCTSENLEVKSGIMHTSLPVGSLFLAEKKLASFIEEDKFIRLNYHKFCMLTKREREIIGLIAEGRSCLEISDMLFISLHTVHNHRKHINHKLEITSLSKLIRFAIEFKLI